MTIQPGTRLGPYEVVAPIGAGGMGEVYRARDTRLERHVAIKILPTEFAQNAPLKLRFEREARTISSLNHPNICQLYDVGENYLVMEFLEGETLAERLKRGALPLNQVLKIGIEIALALDRAHRQGIIHRDLKPSNIMLTKSGTKLLDFGLAKVHQPGGPIAGLTHAPTEHKEQLTQEGTILGTFQYMAPEQLEGTEADARSDIWALGAVLYEMVTGRKAFEGKSKTSLIAAIVDRDPPPISSIQPTPPPAFDRVIRTCLEKDRDERWQNAHDVARELQWLASEISEPKAERSSSRVSHRRERLAWWLAATMALVAIGSLTTSLSRRAPLTKASALRLSLPPMKGFSGGLTISPDGTRVTFIAPGPAGKPVLWVRPLNSELAHPLVGTDGAIATFWSPDSRQLAFFADQKLKRIDAAGGTPVTICDAPRPAGGSWNASGDIIFVPEGWAPVHRVSAAGGVAKPLVPFLQNREERGHGEPHFLPDGRHFVFSIFAGKPGVRGIYLASLDNPTARFLFFSRTGAIYSQGFLLFREADALMAQPFDLDRLALSGDRISVAERIGNTYAASANGILIHEVAGRATRQLAWLDRAGREIQKIGEPATIYHQLRISPDASKAVVVGGEWASGFDLWLVDLIGGTRSQLTFDPGLDADPAWSPDGSQIAFSSDRLGDFDVYVKSLSAGTSEKLLLSSPMSKWVKSWTNDGRSIAYLQLDPSGRTRAGNLKTNIWLIPVDSPNKPAPYATSEAHIDWPNFSSNGRWVAYTSDELGRQEVLVSPASDLATRWRVSSGGIPTFSPAVRWRRDGREILYLAPDWTLMSVQVKVGTEFKAEEAKPLFKLDPGTGWDVSPDGQRFLVARPVEGTQDLPLAVIINWTAELKQ